MVGGAPPPLRPSNFGPADLYFLHSSHGPAPRPSNFDDGSAAVGSPRFGHYPAPNPEISSTSAAVTKKPTATNPTLPATAAATQQQQNKAAHHDAKELHMFVWSSSTSPVSDAGGLHVFGGADFAAPDLTGRLDHGGAKEIRMLVPADLPQNGGTKVAISEGEHYGGGGEDFSFEGGKGLEDLVERDRESGPDGLSKLGSSSTAELHPKGGGGPSDGTKHTHPQMPPASVMTRLENVKLYPCRSRSWRWGGRRGTGRGRKPDRRRRRRRR